jgi:hypothetical protein
MTKTVMEYEIEAKPKLHAWAAENKARLLSTFTRRIGKKVHCTGIAIDNTGQKYHKSFVFAGEPNGKA